MSIECDVYEEVGALKNRLNYFFFFEFQKFVVFVLKMILVFLDQMMRNLR